MRKKSAKITVAMLCGGPSLERGISLNSARSVIDHLASEDIQIIPIYFDSKRRAYKISTAQLYSNTPSDFDFKLKQAAQPLREKSLIRILKKTDITFPVMHGPFGEDGQIQGFLERHGVPFVGSSSVSCKRAFDKFRANKFIRQNGFFAAPSVVLKIYHGDHRRILEDFFKRHRISRAIVKPAAGGSSIGVFSVSNVDEALEKAHLLFSKRMDTRVVVEPFAQGSEFTVIILQNRFGLSVALPPTEIQTDYTEHQFFDFRKKYLPTRQVTWHCPPRFDAQTVEKIQAQGEQLFALFGMRDFARFDGWVLPDGNIWFCDFNPVSGMEQNSFLFQQASRIGMTHTDVLQYILEQACARYSIPFLTAVQKEIPPRRPVNIIMGGDNSERQVSLMSGTNVWLKLRRSKKYHPNPYLIDLNGTVWHVPYHLSLNHTVEEIAQNCNNYENTKEQLADFEERTRLRLGLVKPKDKEEFFDPEKLTLKKFFDDSQFVFIALHGGDGENGNFQKTLTVQRVKFNGADEHVSRLCMDKWQTSRRIDSLNIEGVTAIPGTVLQASALFNFKDSDFKVFWRETRNKLDADTLIVKPRSDGCTTGVVHLYSSNDLQTYVKLVREKVPFIPKRTFTGQVDIIEMPPVTAPELLFEKFIETDILRVKANALKHRAKTGWIEVTVGVVEIDGSVYSFNPSITVVEGEVLTVEEKFQGGTGVNITPPPPTLMKPKIVQKVKNRIEKLAGMLDIRGYSRIDAFVHIYTGDLAIIEINTLPGLTPSTVLYQQALAEREPLFPTALLEQLIQNKGY